jgi:hypothetical protein
LSIWITPSSPVSVSAAALAAARIRAVRARADGDELREAAFVGLGDGIADEWRPVAVSPEHRQVDAATLELRFEGRLELAVLLVDRADAVEGAVVVRHLFETRIGDATATGHVAQEWDHVILPLGAAEARQQDGVIGGRLRHVLRAVLRRIRRAAYQIPGELTVGDGHRSTSAMSETWTRRPV